MILFRVSKWKVQTKKTYNIIIAIILNSTLISWLIYNTALKLHLSKDNKNREHSGSSTCSCGKFRVIIIT